MSIEHYSTEAQIERFLESDPRAQIAANLLDRSAISLDSLIERAGHLTRNQSGISGDSPRPILLYAPIYLASRCVNRCLYCGFNATERIERKKLSAEELIAESEILTSWGIRHQLLVAGEDPGLGSDFFPQMTQLLADRGIEVTVEIAPQSLDAYRKLVGAGTIGVTLYQETYDRALYSKYHPGDTPKSSFDWRIESAHRAASAGMGRFGFGFLLGLADPREELLNMIAHAAVIKKEFPEIAIAFSLPRINQSPGAFVPPFPVDDELFVRLYCILRIVYPESTLTLSTREPAALRNYLTPICINQLSAGSSTAPGGYSKLTCQKAIDNILPDGQFPITDERSVEEVARWLSENSLKPIWTFDVA
jgi:2-iminoacetate synthase